VAYRGKPWHFRRVVSRASLTYDQLTACLGGACCEEPALDANCERVKANTYPWPG